MEMREPDDLEVFAYSSEVLLIAEAEAPKFTEWLFTRLFPAGTDGRSDLPSRKLGNKTGGGFLS
jgi:hypothetical protein